MREREQPLIAMETPPPAAVDRQACPPPVRHPANAALCLRTRVVRALAVPREGRGDARSLRVPRGRPPPEAGSRAAPSHEQGAMLKSINTVLPLNLTGGVE